MARSIPARDTDHKSVRPQNAQSRSRIAVRMADQLVPARFGSRGDVETFDDRPRFSSAVFPKTTPPTALTASANRALALPAR